MSIWKFEEENDIVAVYAYRHLTEGGSYYCELCVKKIYPHYCEEHESEYNCYWEKYLSKWKKIDYTSRDNYCGECKKPLYELEQANEQCRSRPTSIKLRRLFNRRRRQYGRRVGGTYSRPEPRKLF